MSSGNALATGTDTSQMWVLVSLEMLEDTEKGINFPLLLKKKKLYCLNHNESENLMAE